MARIPDHIAAAIKRLCNYAHDLDVTERPAIGEYDVTEDLRLICDTAVNAITGHPLPSEGAYGNRNASL